MLHGITRQTVFDLGARRDMEAHAGRMTGQQLPTADEIFVTSTACCVMPVTRLNDVPIGDGQPGR